MDLTSWIGFNILVAILLAIDLYFSRDHHIRSTRESILWSAFWIGLALLFNLYIYYVRGIDDAINFLTCYLIEKNLSLDNLFIFYLIFKSFHIPDELTHKPLFWGIIGAIMTRTAFILGGIALVDQFHFLFYILGAFLIYMGTKMLLAKRIHKDPQKNGLVLFFERFFPYTHAQSDRFFVENEGKWVATPLFLALLAVESTDILFTIDSIPALFGITLDPYIIYTSNIFAILGLRSLYFVIVATFLRMQWVETAIAGILCMIGVTMLLEAFFDIPAFVKLISVLFILIISFLLRKKS